MSGYRVNRCPVRMVREPFPELLAPRLHLAARFEPGDDRLMGQSSHDRASRRSKVWDDPPVIVSSPLLPIAFTVAAGDFRAEEC
jgi:hypothetical protein